MKKIVFLIAVVGLGAQANAQGVGHGMPHHMQHGFVLAAADRFASHLVATGHHSRQTEITGELVIQDRQEQEVYQKRKVLSAGQTYFLFQAQSLDLPTLKVGQVLSGHIVEARIGDYDPKNVIVKKASYRVQRIFLNMENPFFRE
jgi:hypothetical protein